MQVTRNMAKTGFKQALKAGVAAAVLLISGAAIASAQEVADFDRGQNVSVLERARPDYDPTGIQLGAFIVKPRLSVGVETTDNVFFQQDDQQDDFAYVLQPEVDVSTTWSRNSAQLTVGLTDRKWDEFDSENRTDEYVRGQVRIDIAGSTAVTIGGSHQNYGESRGAPDAPGGAAKPGDVKSSEVFVAGTQTFNRVRVTARATMRKLEFDRVPLTAGGFDDSPERDRDEMAIDARVEYAVSPRTSVFVQAGHEQRDYDLKPPVAAFNRDNELNSVLGGVSFDVSALARGEIAVGYLDQSFDASNLDGASGMAVTAQLEWFPQEITTVTFDASRRAEETNFGVAGSYLLTEAGARVDHELLRNVILNARISAGKREFEGIARDDELANAGVGVRYLVNRDVEVGAGWTFERQESSGALRDRDYDVNRISISLTLRR